MRTCIIAEKPSVARDIARIVGATTKQEGYLEGSGYLVTDEVPNILNALGARLPMPLNRHSVDNSKVTDHHAIIPTGEEPFGLSADESLVYRMVTTRFIEAFSPKSEEERMQLQLSDGTHSYEWKACRTISLGWKAVASDMSNGAQAKDSDEEEEQMLLMLPNLVESEILPLRSAEVTSHKTKPKPLYTEASLLSAMEHAGREVDDTESRRAIADCGIGTPATRANIIETLILRAYIRREKKSIIPTEKGLAVYDIIKEQRIANAEMAGNWKLALAAIEAGTMPAEKFAEGIRSYATSICQELLSLPSESHSSPSYPSYVCPKYSRSSVGIYPKTAKCRETSCGFVLFREVCGTLLSEDNIRDLITTRRTPILKGLVSKAGKKFNARLVLVDDFRATFEFEGKKR